MKFLKATRTTHRLLVLSLATVTVVSANGAFVPSSQALAGATTSFACGKSDGKPATVARTKKGDIPIVVWTSADFNESGFTPQVRCQQVSARFQSLYRSGQLQSITFGTLNRQNVVCATTKASSACTQQNLLYTLKPNSNPKQAIERLKAIRNRASSGGIEESASSEPNTASNSIDLDWLNEDN
jgi:hypothetical protein